MAHNMPLGISEFREVREGQTFYVDKTRLVCDLIRDRAKVILLPRPRRFGKTLNLTMLREFFDDRASSHHLFEGLAVSADPLAMAHLGAYATLYITFKDLKPRTWASCERHIIYLISEMFKDHRDRLDETHLHADELEQVQNFIAERVDLERCQYSLSLLTRLLQRITGKRVILLIDEYDSPIHAGYQNGYRDEIVSFMRDFLSNGFKDNPALEKGVLTGILRVAKDTIFSGLNNIKVYTILDKPFSAHFGFTEPEVQHILASAGMSDRLHEVQRWYNGYRFGESTIYNPWSMLSILMEPDAPFSPHWINTANNSLIRDLVIEERAMSLSELTTLLSGNTVERSVDLFVALNDLKPENIWGLLLLSGYLTLSEKQPDGPMHKALRIPNLEVRTFFESTVSHWLGQQTHADALMRALLVEDMPRFAELLGETVVQVLSYHDTGGKDNERVYHVFLAGLLANLNRSHQILSNRESGFGRYDLALVPKQEGETGFIFEIKRGEAKHLEMLARRALEQIDEQDYTAVLRERGVGRIRQIGLAFDGKHIILASRVWESTMNEQSELSVVSFSSWEKSPQPDLPVPADRDPQDAPTPRENLLERATLVGKIQMLQELKGQPTLATQALLHLDETVLKAMITALQHAAQ